MFRFTHTSRRLSLIGICAVVLGLLLATGARLNNSQLRLPGAVANAAVSKSYEQFINDAYQGAYGRQPDCATELLPEYDRMVNAAASNTLLEECKRFVSTLFETQASYNVADYTTYLQTAEYQQRNAQDQADRPHQEAFVTDLYWAFLQRAPDASGLNFWTDNVMNETRKKGIIAFAVSIEFNDQVNLLFPDARPSCLIFCPECNPDPCEGPNSGGHYSKLCQ
jgi:hypothetical protein